MDTTPRASGFRLQGRHVLMILLGFFATVLAVDAVFTVLAVRSFPGQVSDRPYEDGLAFNQRLAADRAQAALGWRARVATGAEPGLVRVELTDRSGAPLSALSVEGELTRPATEAGRRRLKFLAVGPGLYEARVAVPGGAWDLALRARDGQGRALNAERRLTWR